MSYIQNWSERFRLNAEPRPNGTAFERRTGPNAGFGYGPCGSGCSLGAPHVELVSQRWQLADQ